MQKGFSSENRAKGYQTKVCDNSLQIMVIISEPFYFKDAWLFMSSLKNLPFVNPHVRRVRRRSGFPGLKPFVVNLIFDLLPAANGQPQTL